VIVTPAAVDALNRRFLADYPREAARELERLAPADAAALLSPLPASIALPVWQALMPDAAAGLVNAVPNEVSARWLAEAQPSFSASVLAQLGAEQREASLARLDRAVADELRALVAYPDGTAGRMMDPNVAALRSDTRVEDALRRLKSIRRRGLRELFVVDDEGRLSGRVEIQDLAVADPASPLREITRPPVAVLRELDPREDLVAILEQHPISEVPVVNLDGRFVGVIQHSVLMSAVEQETSADIQAMVGASRDERALSTAGFAVRKRLPWLQINLATAFLAAAVGGLFEGTIARFTALAVLLPVVAGQSGNDGAQALAVTLRGLALREIGIRHWRNVLTKELVAGLANGVAVAATTALGVYVWSRSAGLVAVCAAAMVISMVVAGLAGALTPILLRRFGQDPATSSSIILTTVTDIVGFFSFLGIATVLAAWLEAGPPG
jgi:magnesium transporter